MRYLAALLLLGFVACKSDPPAPQPECTKTEDCGDGKVCTADQHCVADLECGTDADCDPRRTCDPQGSCVPRPGFGDECGPLRPCAFGQFCSPLLGLCLSSDEARDCTRRSQCPAGQLCDREASKCVVDPGCYGDAFCEDGEVCDLTTRECRAAATACTPCDRGSCATGACRAESKECINEGAEPACREGEFCDPLGRCVQCTRTADCGPGLYCNAALGVCESNVVCADTAAQCPTTPDVACIVCEAPQVCDAFTKRCQAPPTECETDVDCIGDQYCDLELDPPVCVVKLPACIDDRQGEPNDDLTHAALIEADIYPELKACPGTQDWYRLHVAGGTYLTLDLRFSHQDGDLDLQLFLADGKTLVDESRSITDHERVELEVGTDIDLVVRVFFASRTVTPVPYVLLLGRDPGPLCRDDTTEDDDALGSARRIESDRPVHATMCAADPDWYVIDAEAGQKIVARLEHPSGLGNLDLELHRAGASASLLEARTNSPVEVIETTAGFTGPHYFRVVGRAADQNVYDLRVDLRDGDGSGCIDDPFEPNETAEQTRLAPEETGSLVDLTLCAGDEDWFLVNLGPEETLRAEVGFEVSADVELALYSPDTNASSQAPLVISAGTGPRESLAYRATVPGDYLLRVYAPNPQQSSPYELRIDRDPPFICEADGFDRANKGNDLAGAIPLGRPPLRVDEVTVCLDDSDWYRFTMLASFVNVIRLSYLDADASIDATLYDGNGIQLISTGGVGTNFKEISVRVPGPEGGTADAVLQVRKGAGQEAAYALAVDLVPIFTCDPDGLELNDGPSFPTVVESLPFVSSALTLCVSEPGILGGGDEDWFQVKVEAGQTISAQLGHSFGDLFLELWSPGAVRRACNGLAGDRCYSDSIGRTELVTFTATTTEAYYVRVGSVYGNPTLPGPLSIDTPYELRIEAQ